MCNIYTGAESGQQVNSNKAIELGMEQQQEFVKGLPGSFYQKISPKVVTMKESKKGKKPASETYNPELLFSRVFYLLSAGHIEMENLFDYEIARSLRRCVMIGAMPDTLFQSQFCKPIYE